MLSEIDKTTALFDVLFGRLSAKGLSSRENSEKQSSSIAINAILTGSGFAPIPWLPVPEFNSFRVYIILKYLEEFLRYALLFLLAWIMPIIECKQGIMQSQP